MPGSIQVVSQDDEGTPLGRVWTTAHVEAGPATLPRPYRTLNAYVLVVIQGGAGRYEAPDRDAEAVGRGDAIMVVPHQPHWYGPAPGHTWDETFVVFDGRVFDTLAAAGILTSAKAVRRLPAAEQWCRKIRRFVDRTRGGFGIHERSLVVMELASLLVEIYAADAAAPVQSRAIIHARELLGTNLYAHLDMRVVAERVGLPYETFRKQFRDEVGIPPARFRDEKRMEAARTLLRVTAMTHASIAKALGFADEHHFSKRFRATNGISPRIYRRQ